MLALMRWKRRPPLAPVEREPHRHRQEQHVAEWVGHRHEAAGRRKGVVVEVGGGQPYPRRMGQAAVFAASIALPRSPRCVRRRCRRISPAISMG